VTDFSQKETVVLKLKAPLLRGCVYL